MPTICLAIPTYNRELVLVNTLEQVFAQDFPADEVLVVDQTLEHEEETTTYLTVAEQSGRIRWLKQQQPSLPAARNRALRETRCDVILFIDDDVRLPRDFVWRHLRNYLARDVVAVAGRILQPPGFRYQSRCPPWPRVMDHLYFPLNATVRTEGVATFGGGNHSARSSFLRRIGGYDPNYLGYAFREDSDAAIRIWKAGGTVVFDPEAEIEHLAVPRGGCRIHQHGDRTPEWLVSFAASYFAWRHFFPAAEFWRQVLLVNLRKYALRRENACRPWRLPWAVLTYIYSLARSGWTSRTMTPLPWTDNA